MEGRNQLRHGFEAQQGLSAIPELETAPEQPRPGEPAAADPEAEARAELMQRLNAAAVTTLGQVATTITNEGVYGTGASEPEDHEEPDIFSWKDAAHWRADGGPDELDDSAILDELFARVPNAEFGSLEDMGGAASSETRDSQVARSCNRTRTGSARRGGLPRTKS